MGLDTRSESALKICYPLKDGVLVADGQLPESLDALPKHERTTLQHVLLLQRDGWNVECRRTKRNLPAAYNPTSEAPEQSAKQAFIFRGAIYRYYFQALAFAEELVQRGWPSVPHGQPAAYYRALFDDKGLPQAPGATCKLASNKQTDQAASLGMATIEVDQGCIASAPRKQRRMMPLQEHMAEPALVGERVPQRVGVEVAQALATSSSGPGEQDGVEVAQTLAASSSGPGEQDEALIDGSAAGVGELPGDVLLPSDCAVSSASEVEEEDQQHLQLGQFRVHGLTHGILQSVLF